MTPSLAVRAGCGWLALFVATFTGSTLLATVQSDQPPTSNDSQARNFGQELRPIFNGTNLNGWIIRGGKASYVVEDGVIVGTTTIKGGGNTFLCTERQYGDFILELEIKADPELNSGVQIRSQSFDAETTYDFGDHLVQIPAQRVHGYQVEVDHRSERRWSGGVYDEGRRNWLFPLATNSAAGQAFKIGGWNKYRIQCLGSSIRTWVNDVPAADLVDAETLRGFIGLQVHGAEKPGLQVRFRNVRLQDLGTSHWAVAWDCSSLEGLEESGPAKWTLAAHTLQAAQAKEAHTVSALTGNTPLMNFTVRLKYKIAAGGFTLAFHPPSDATATAGFGFAFAERMGATNITHLQDWNTVVASVQPDRFVVILNGHQVKDLALSRAGGVCPRLELPAGRAAEVYFKDFEILASKP
ncbi:MAG: DUF1080 domain-containing protein [Verrucomicrobiota bacterium]